MSLRNKTIVVALASAALLFTACNKNPDVFLKTFNDHSTVKYCVDENDETKMRYAISVYFNANGKKRTVSCNEFTAKKDGQLIGTGISFITTIKESGTPAKYTGETEDSKTFGSGEGSTFYVGFEKDVTDCEFYYNNVVITPDNI